MRNQEGNWKTLLKEIQLLLDDPDPRPTMWRSQSTAITVASRGAAPESSTTRPSSPNGSFPGLAAAGMVEATGEIDGNATMANR